MSEEPQKNRFAALSDFGGGEAENDFAADMRRIMEANNTQKQADTLGAVSNGAGDDESYLEKDIDIDALISSFDTIGLKAGVDFGMDELLSELRVVGQQVREEQKAELEKAMTRNFKESIASVARARLVRISVCVAVQTTAKPVRTLTPANSSRLLPTTTRRSTV
ncbi:MAG: hypothetical protein MHM6MM_004861 [Cercozoa sp. M6MM]